MQISGTHHVAVFTRNLAELQQFYVDVLGLPIVGNIKRTDINIVYLGAGGTAIELIERNVTNEAGHGAPSWDHIALEVADLDQAVAELQQQGIAFHVLPRDFPAERPLLRIAFCKDPDGNDVEFVQTLGARYAMDTP